ncbi:MAG: hypothetical protein HXK08_02280 [Actinomyces sp.]|nr:hypothetical protein [Actinomyces sp.]
MSSTSVGFSTVIDGQRLRDIADLPLDLAI